MRDRCTCQQRQDEERLGHEVAVAHRVERVLERGREAEVGGDAVGVEGQRRAGQRAGAQRATRRRGAGRRQRSTSRASAQTWASR